jgi:hypothetical protein
MSCCCEALLRMRGCSSSVIPAKAEIQFLISCVEKLVPGFRRDEDLRPETGLP